MLFDLIAPVYGLFYHRQRKRYGEIIAKPLQELGVTSARTVIDIGCGTGALCSVFSDMGHTVTGVDPAAKMLAVARQKNTERVRLIQADALKGLPFADKSFDLAIASYVAHGLTRENRQRLYAEMSRLAREWVIIHDYNRKRSLLTTLIEWLERGDYFHFILNAEQEMRECISDMNVCFATVKIVDVDVCAAWYLCKPADN